MTRRGLTLLELLLVLGILGVFLGLALPLLSPNRLALDQAARSLATTLVVALVSTLVSTVLGTLLALGLVRYRFPGKGFLRYLLYVPVVVPDVVMGVSLLLLFALAKEAGVEDRKSVV